MYALQTYFKEHREQHLDELFSFLRIKSVSALSEHKNDMRSAADWIADALHSISMENITLLETKGNPVVYADYLHAPSKKTVLIYGHYDVQPVDPLNLWESEPFSAVIKDDKIFARGSSDDKGQVFMQIKAIEALMKSPDGLPVNVKFCFEGEEEIGSAHLPELLEKEKDRFKADVLVISDTTIFGPMQPAICYGIRGLCGMQVDVQAAKSDLHSGLFGGAVPNALHALVQLLDTLHDGSGKVAVAGFYDDVEPLSDKERHALRELPFDEETYQTDLGLHALVGEPGYSTLERVMARPTLELNGVYGGFQGEGSKTVIPAVAHAKITCRLVNHQDPDKILDLLEKHIVAHTPKGATVSVTKTDRGRPFVTPLDAPEIEAAAVAYEKGYGVKPFYMRMGGSIPIVENFASLLQIPVVLMGFSLPDENFHAPNEHFSLENFDRGLVTLAYYYQLLGRN